jgi:hypothetical protein
MHTSEMTNSLFKALIEAAPEISSIGKSKQAYGYKYATLDSLIDMLRTVLPKHGLWYVQMPTRQNGVSALTTRVFHTSGEWIEDSIEMTDTELQGKANDTQRVGASITYYRRYALSAIFGVAADEDVDGNINNIRQQPTRQTTQPAKKQDPLAYIKADIKARQDGGEVHESILKDYADLLKTDLIREVDDMNEAEQTALATAIFKRRKSNQ